MNGAHSITLLYERPSLYSALPDHSAVLRCTTTPNSKYFNKYVNVDRFIIWCAMLKTFRTTLFPSVCMLPISWNHSVPFSADPMANYTSWQELLRRYTMRWCCCTLVNRSQKTLARNVCVLYMRDKARVCPIRERRRLVCGTRAYHTNTHTTLVRREYKGWNNIQGHTNLTFIHTSMLWQRLTLTHTICTIWSSPQ